MVTFQEEGHKYLNSQGEQYISVTTLLSRYKKPFDSEYWSTYKALKLVLEKHGSWPRFKELAGGWDKVVAHYNQMYTNKPHPYKSEIEAAKQGFLNAWEKKGKDARESGTAYHQMMDSTTRAAGFNTFRGKEFPVQSPTDLLNNQSFRKDGIYNELLLYNDHYKLAGTADKVIKEGNTIHIRDYKTSEKIEMEAFQDEVLKHPLHLIPACNYYEYSLQLSIYAWMLEIVGYHIGDLGIEHVKDNNKIYEVRYMRDEVQALLSHYGETVLHKAPFHYPKPGTGLDFKITF